MTNTINEQFETLFKQFEQARRLVKELNADELAETHADAARYRAFFDAGLPITFMGQDYHDKSALDVAIDAAIAKIKGMAA